MQTRGLSMAQLGANYAAGRRVLHLEQLPQQPLPREKVQKATRIRRRLAELQIDREIRDAA